MLKRIFIFAALLSLAIGVRGQIVITGNSYSVVAVTPTASTPTFSPISPYTGGATTVTASTATSGCGTYIYFDTSNPPTTNQTTYSFTTTVTLYAYVHGCPGYLDSLVSTWSGTLGFTDNFPTTGPLSASWTLWNVGGFTGVVTQASGKAIASTGANSAAFINVGGFSSTSQSIKATLNVTWSGLLLNADATGKGIFFQMYATPDAIYTVSAGVRSSVAACSGTSSLGDTFRFSVSGTTYTVYDVTSNTTLCTVSESGYSGAPGIFVYGTAYDGPVIAQ